VRDREEEDARRFAGSIVQQLYRFRGDCFIGGFGAACFIGGFGGACFRMGAAFCLTAF
jgi:hypothetical protein